MTAFVLQGFEDAWALLTGGDAEVWHATGLTFLVTLLATGLAALGAIPYGFWLARSRPPLARTQVFLLRYAMFVPTVILGLIVYALLSRQGPLGGLGWLYTPQAIVIGEVLLAFPILGSFAWMAASGERGRAVDETARTLGASRVRRLWTLASEFRGLLVGAWLVAVARCYAELGIVGLVGGGLRLKTRTLSSTIQLELRRGDFARAVACGVVLLLVAMAFAIVGDLLARRRRA